MSARVRSLVLVVMAALVVQSAGRVGAQAPAPAKPETPPAAQAPAPAPKPKVTPARRYASTDEAAQALVTAVRTNDNTELIAILGSEARPLLSSGDSVSDRKTREDFVAKYDAVHKLVADGNKTVLQVGTDDWPFPIPLVKDGDRWYFDVRQGREEILARRIGRNEIYTMQTCLAYVDAQREYYSQDRNGDGILEYAQKFASTPGKRDGLYWDTQPNETPSPLGDLVVKARAEGYRRDKGGGPTPYHGYLYRILTAQGPAAKDGAYNYVVKGRMIGGFALVAFPAQNGNSAVMTFLVNHDGEIFQKNLGPNTRSTALALKTFNPDGTWTKVDVPEVPAKP